MSFSVSCDSSAARSVMLESNFSRSRMEGGVGLEGEEPMSQMLRGWWCRGRDIG